jgi:hypothetical protein
MGSSNIGTYISLIVSDTVDLTSAWSDVALSILNDLPWGELALASVGTTIVLFGCDRIYRFARSSSRVSHYPFSFNRTTI